MRCARDEDYVYILVVSGCVGPASRRALEPASVGASEHQTVLRAGPGEGDLVDLLHRLVERGLVVSHVAVLA